MAASASPSAVWASPCAACRTKLAAWPSDPGRGLGPACAAGGLAAASAGGNLGGASAPHGCGALAFEGGGGV